MLKRRESKKGVTLIELVVYMGILSIILVLFIQMYALLVDKQLETESSSSVSQDSNYLLLKLSSDFQQADSVSIPSTPGQITAYLNLITDTVTTTYVIENNNLIASSSGTKMQLNGFDTTVSNLSFQRLGLGNEKDVVRIQLTIASKTKRQSGYETYQLSTSLGTREK